MKIKFILVIISLSIIIASCGKDEEVGKPDIGKEDNFEVKYYTVTSTTDASGSPVKQVTFSFQGDASDISFYSGEIGNDYAYRDGRTRQLLGFFSSFSNTLANTGTQENQLSVLVSTDFNGIYDITNIKAANWIDITSRYAITSLRNTTLPSGTIDIKDLFVNGKPLYYAFRYICEPQSLHGGNSTWRIRDFLLQYETDLGIKTLATHTTADWHLINEGEIVNAGRGAAIETNGALRFNGNHQDKEVRTESWGISKKITID